MMSFTGMIELIHTLEVVTTDVWFGSFVKKILGFFSPGTFLAFLNKQRQF